MMRTQIVKLAGAYPRYATRSFSAAAIRAAEGDTGGIRSGGSASADSFNKREAASENKFIRDKERETLRNLKEKLKVQRKHLDELDAHIDDLSKGSGGEHH